MVVMVFFKTGNVLAESKLTCAYFYMLAAYSKMVRAN